MFTLALNPPLVLCTVNDSVQPIQIQGEYFILERHKLYLNATITSLKDGKKQCVEGWGKVYLTTLRLVFIHDKWRDHPFRAFDFPVALMQKEAFNQPILWGANNLTMTVQKWQVGPTEVKLSFYDGGSGTLLRTLNQLLVKHRARACARASPFVASVADGSFQAKCLEAYVDPSDPTTIYIPNDIVEKTSNNRAISRPIAKAAVTAGSSASSASVNPAEGGDRPSAVNSAAARDDSSVTLPPSIPSTASHANSGAQSATTTNSAWDGDSNTTNSAESGDLRAQTSVGEVGASPFLRSTRGMQLPHASTLMSYESYLL